MTDKEIELVLFRDLKTVGDKTLKNGLATLFNRLIDATARLDEMQANVMLAQKDISDLDTWRVAVEAKDPAYQVVTEEEKAKREETLEDTIKGVCEEYVDSYVPGSVEEKMSDEVPGYVESAICDSYDLITRDNFDDAASDWSYGADIPSSDTISELCTDKVTTALEDCDFVHGDDMEYRVKDVIVSFLKWLPVLPALHNGNGEQITDSALKAWNEFAQDKKPNGAKYWKVQCSTVERPEEEKATESTTETATT